MGGRPKQVLFLFVIQESRSTTLSISNGKNVRFFVTFCINR